MFTIENTGLDKETVSQTEPYKAIIKIEALNIFRKKDIEMLQVKTI